MKTTQTKRPKKTNKAKKTRTLLQPIRHPPVEKTEASFHLASGANDELRELLGEEFVLSVTSANQAGEELRNKTTPDEHIEQQTR